MFAAPSDPIARDWLVRLRWAAVLGIAVAGGIADRALGLPIPAAPVGAVLLVTALSNLALARAGPAVGVPAALLFDLAALTTLLALTGGASNPFSVLYLVHVALAALLLGPAWTWGVAVCAAAGFAALYPFTDPHAMHQGPERIRAHLVGMWVAFAVAALALAWFVGRLAATLRAREREVERLRDAAEQHERVVALATLAAGAAHELGSPLAVIAVAARELEQLTDGPAAEEARAIRGQVERCRTIVTRLTQQAGVGQAEPVVTVPSDEVWADFRATLGERDAARLQVSGHGVLRAPRRALLEALGSLVRNALLAGPGPVRVELREERDATLLTVHDEGEGMSADVLARAGNPFFTTRPPGAGMGLGLFLARRFAESLGGALELTSSPGAGTHATLRLPR